MVIIFCSKATLLIIHVQMCALLVLLGSLAKELTLMLIAVTFKCTLYSTQHSDQRQRMYSAVYWGCARYHWSFDLWWWCKIQRLKSYATTCAIKQNYWPRGPLSTQFCAENGPLLTRWTSPGGICWMEIYISSKLIFKLILGIDAGGMSSEIVRRLMSLDLTNI